MQEVKSKREKVKRRKQEVRKVIPLALLSFFLFPLSFSCRQPPGVHPWRDDSIPHEAWTTPSQEGILAAARSPVIRERPVEPAVAPDVDWGVPHFPLWWEDPFEDKGSRDGQFRWTWEDYFAMPYSLGRSLLNTAAFPVSAIVTPPGTPMVSDGVVRKHHDAERGRSPDPTATAADFGYTEPPEPLEIVATPDAAPGP
jgi:hypothetical protein